MLQAVHVSVDFANKSVFDDLNLSVERGTILSIIGPNGSGKSTLLKALSRIIKPQQGQIFLDGKLINSYSANSLALAMAVLPQTPTAPRDLTVRDLVQYGRFPHQHWWKNTQKEDRQSVERALDQTGVASLSERLLDTLSGGERQRVWLAMALAQKPQLLLLDEPTTFLDIAHQLEILELIAHLNQIEEITIIMVIHDINHAAQYSHRIAVLNQGHLFAVGRPEEVINHRTLREVFGVEADIWQDQDHRPVCLVRRLTDARRQK